MKIAAEKALLHSAHCIQQQEQHHARKQPLHARIKELNELIDERLPLERTVTESALEELRATIYKNAITTPQLKCVEAKLQEERTQRDFCRLHTLTTAESGLRVQRQEL